MCKVHTSSHEVTNAPYVRANDENTTTTVTADLTINYDVEKNTSLAEKIKNVGEYNEKKRKVIIRSTQVSQRPLFCNSSLFYMLLYHFTL